jgi:alpha-tubulin suppressor-like RCC1 family protein
VTTTILPIRVTTAGVSVIVLAVAIALAGVELSVNNYGESARLAHGASLLASSSTVYRWGVPFPGGGGVRAGMEDDLPTVVDDLPSQVSEVVTSNSDTYALDSNGAVWAWGADGDGEFGNGTTTSFSGTPVQVKFPAGVVIAKLPSPMPFNTGLAIDTSGNVWGWGYNKDEELCLPSKPAPYLVPTRLPLAHVTLASGAAGHALYDSNGTIYSCGNNTYGQLGDGRTTSAASAVPVPVAGLPRQAVRTLVSSWGNSGALMADGTYYDWGYNSSGQLGDGKTNNSSLAVVVDLGAAVTSVSEGGSNSANGQTLVVLSDSSVWSWGNGSFGQLGDGSRKSSASPIRIDVPTVVTISQVVTGGSSSYAIDDFGDVWAWGQNNYGQLGNGTAGSEVTTKPASLGISMAEISSTAANVAGLERSNSQ